MSKNKIDENDLDSLEAYLIGIKGDSEEALKRLSDKTDPASIKRKLSLLIEKGEINTVIETVAGLQLSTEWTQLLIFAYGNKGNLEEIEYVISWIKENGNNISLMHALVGLNEGVISKIFSSKNNREKLFPSLLNENDIKLLKFVYKYIEPIVRAIIIKNNIDNNLEEKIIINYSDILFLLHKHEEFREIIDVLIKRKPINEKVGSAILQGIYPNKPGISDRLWEENPSSFDSKYISCLLKIKDKDSKEEIIGKLFNLFALAKTNEELTSICEFLYEVYEFNNFEDFKEKISKYIDENSEILKYVEVKHYIKVKNVVGAERLLEKIKDKDTYVHKYLKAEIEEKKENYTEAIKLYDELHDISGDISCLDAVFRISKKISKTEILIKSLKKLLLFYPDNYEYRFTLAKTYFDQNNYQSAKKHFYYIYKLKPNDPTAAHNYISCIYQLREIKEAITAINDLSYDIENIPLLKQLKAKILQSTGDVDDAFIEMESIKELEWDKPEYLIGYVQVAYSAGKEKEANEALVKLNQLHGEGKVDENIFFKMTLPEIKGLIEENIEKKEKISGLIIEGKAPWAMLALLDKQPLFWLWALKTQPIGWMQENKRNYAYYSTYASNFFTVVNNDNIKKVTEIKAARISSSIVIDISSLITLNYLEQLGNIFKYFENIYIPQIYIEKSVHDNEYFIPHQKSKVDSTNKIIEYLTNGKIKIYEDFSRNVDLVIIDEYVEDNSQYKIINILDELNNKGYVEEGHYLNIKKTIKSSEDNKVNLGSDILIELSTLYSLDNFKLLDKTIALFNVYISKEARDELSSTKSAFKYLEDTKKIHQSFWEKLKKEKKVIFEPAPASKKNEENQFIEYELASLALSQSKNIPLLVDDRVLQTVKLNENNKFDSSSFCSFQLIESFNKNNLITDKQAAETYFKMVQWRYKFMIIPSEHLKIIADQYINHLPGEKLLIISKYVHDCMRDPGLFCGLEISEPPTSMGARLFIDWCSTIGQLIMRIWEDENYTDANAESFTKWAVSEMLPSVPKYLEHLAKAKIAGYSGRITVSSALLYTTYSNDISRSNKGLRSLSNNLGMTRSEYMHLVLQIIDGNSENEFE